VEQETIEIVLRAQLDEPMWAAEYGNTAAVKILLAAHADANAKDEEGNTTLSIASPERHAEILDLLHSWRP
jgi:ankyrin repeat protein